jgi:hypothetical protein
VERQGEFQRYHSQKRKRGEDEHEQIEMEIEIEIEIGKIGWYRLVSSPLSPMVASPPARA